MPGSRPIPRPLAFLAVLCGGFSGCLSNPPDLAPLADGPWSTYTNDAVGYSVDHPEALAVESFNDGQDIAFRYQGSPVVRVVRVTEDQGRRRGLWVGHAPVGTTPLAGREAKRYIYEHDDGPFVLRTISYVVEHGGKLLALEFRTNGEEGPVHRRILDSFRIREESGRATG